MMANTPKLIGCIFVKYFFRCVIVLQSTYMFAQDISKPDIVLTGHPIFSEASLVIFDSVIISSVNEKIAKTYLNSNKRDSLFRISGITIGKYTIFPFSKGYIIAPIPVIVCTKCKTNIDFIAMPYKDEFKNYLFDKVEIGARYTGGEKAMLKNFQTSLDKSEISKIKGIPDFIIRFYITSNNEISDITFSPGNLDEDIKLILTKAVNSLSNWEVAIVNGKKSDGEYYLSKKIFSQLQ